MLEHQKSLIESKALVLKALAHTTRLFIVEELARGEKCVCEFVDAVKVDFSTISKHLLVLKNAGIVADEKRGQQVFYRLKMKCLPDFIACIGNEIAAATHAKAKMLTEHIVKPVVKTNAEA